MKDKIKIRFSAKVAKRVAANSVAYVIDCILGHADSGYDLSTEAEEFEQNFEEDLDEMGIYPTPHKVGVVKKYYQLEIDKLKSYVDNWYDKLNAKTKIPA